MDTKSNITWNPFTPGYFKNPYGYLDQCRRDNPIHKGIHDSWMFFAYEEVHKILSGLDRKHESTVLYATWGLVKNLLEAVAVQRGIMMVSENKYFDLIQESVGRDTKWVSAFRTAWGLNSSSSQYPTRGAAGLTLYRLTAAMFDGLIPDIHRGVVDNTLRLIKEAGYS